MKQPAKFRKRPVEVEAMRFVGDDSLDNNAARIVRWIMSNGGRAHYATVDMAQGRIVIRTREGEMSAEPGDWVIREPFPTDDRLFYPCKPSIFEATYEELVAPFVTRLDVTP